MELLNAQNREEYEAFVLGHPAGEFTQSLRWPQVKNNWGYEAILSRGKDGALRGAMLVLIQRIDCLLNGFIFHDRSRSLYFIKTRITFIYFSVKGGRRRKRSSEEYRSYEIYFNFFAGI